MRNVLVTGGFGFIGSHLVERLVDDGDRVHVVDNLSSNPLPIEELVHGPRWGGVTYDLQDVETFARSAGDSRFSHIYHLASVVGPAGVLPHCGRIASAIVSDAASVADLALRTSARLLFVSTSEVYGGGESGCCAEAMPKRLPGKSSPRAEYAVGKLAAEMSLENLCRIDRLDVRIVRPFNVAGPRQSGQGGFVLPRFVGQALGGHPLTVFGTGRQVRAFTHVLDIVEGLVAAMERGQPGEVYNLGNTANNCTILQLADEVREAAGSASHVVFVDPKDVYGPLYEEADDKYPDPAKAASELGWVPGRGRRQTIDDTIAYMRGLSPSLFEELCGATASAASPAGR
jgi:UDP-glucose 4-epimerase